MKQMSRDPIIKRMELPEQHHHLQVRQETEALQGASANQIDLGLHHLLPNHGK